MRKSLIIISLFNLVFGLSACKHDEGFGGSAVIQGTVAHHSRTIPLAVVHIKFGAKESQDTLPANYDAHELADSLGNYTFSGLKAGNYYLFASGYDSSISQMVYGGIPVKLKKDDEILTTNVPVTED